MSAAPFILSINRNVSGQIVGYSVLHPANPFISVAFHRVRLGQPPLTRAYLRAALLQAWESSPQDTTWEALFWFFSELSTRPDVQGKVLV